MNNLEFIDSPFKYINKFQKGGDVEGPRYNFFKNIWKNVSNWVINPLQHFSSVTASDDYIPTLKQGHSYNNAIVVRKKNHNLYYYDKDGKLVFQSQVATGANSGPKQEDGDSRTPTGRFNIHSYERKRDPNVFGHNRFLRLNTGKWTGFGIHGDANRPEQIGTDASHGCIRMPNDKLVEFTDLISNSYKNIPVYILDENDQYKLGGKLKPRTVG